MSRRFDDLVPAAQEAYLRFEKGMAEAGIDFLLTCTTRSQQEQDALWAMGRTKPGKKVTWTRHSRHLSGEAFDIVIMEAGKPCWDVRNKKWKQAGAIGRAAGLVWGGDWKHKDYAHFELPREAV